MPEINVIDLVLISVAIWRVSSLFAKEDGPFKVFSKIRLYLGNNRQKSALLLTLFEGVKCIWCNSVWFGTIMVVIWLLSRDIATILSLPFFFSAMVIICDNLIDRLGR